MLTFPPKQLTSRLGFYFNAVKQQVGKTLYVNLKPTVFQTAVDPIASRVVPLIYHEASKHCANLDVRVLQGSLKSLAHHESHIKNKIEVVFTDHSEQNDFESYLKAHFGINSETVPIIADMKPTENNYEESDISDSVEMFDNVVMGGTFDRLHNGHKVLLSEAILRCRKKLTIGVTDGDIIKGKILWELIQPVQKRIELLRDFLEEIDPTLEYLIVPIFDPYGPSTVDPDLECIVASQETERGALRVNEKRQENGLSTLKVNIIALLEDPKRDESEEFKISSSSVRKRLLGTYFNGIPKVKNRLPPQPYLIGLTGGIASGKSTIASDLVQMGAGLVDCDKLAHKTYEPGHEAYRKIVEKFGECVLNEDLTINRQALGEKVFGNEENRLCLNGIVWPAVKKMVDREIQDLFMKGKNIIVLEVAMLIEAGWQSNVHEVWTCIISEKEAVKRIVNRNNLDEDQALKRIQSQTSNSEKVSKADIVFCSAWDRVETRKQVERAWQLLTERIKTDLK